jgi:hypothetical protein
MISKTETVDVKGDVISQVLSETSPHSIELSRNAKGDYSWSIKIYFADMDENDPVGLIEDIDKLLREKFSK